MSSLRIEYHAGGLYLPQLGLWLDPHDSRSGPERVFVSHAHSDHTAAHREVILSAPTARLMQARVPGLRQEHVLNFGETRHFEGGQVPFNITLLPAGHIFGSAMSLVDVEGQSLLYTGDFKLRRSRSAEPCEPRHADVLIMETTFGRVQYVFPPTEAVLNSVTRFCREALDNDETPVLLGYSLGKSQELLCGLADAGLPLVLHGAVHKLTQIYEQFGQCFPKYERYEAGLAGGKVFLCPPQMANSSLVRSLGKTRTAILTGWAVDPNCRYRSRCDAAFPLSDHADFPDLIEMVKQVQPKKVYTLHGFAADFAQTLRDLGYDAQALSQDEQFSLPMAIEDSRSRNESRQPNPVPKSSPVQSDPSHSNPATESFAAFAATCARIAGDTRKLEKVRMLADYLHLLKGESIKLAATWFTGRPLPVSQNKVLQLGWAVLRDALCSAGEISHSVFHQIYLKHSDLGETAAEILESHSTQASLSMSEVGELFQRLQAARGPLAKKPLLEANLKKCTPLEAKYLVKIITSDLRIGLKEGLVEEGIAVAFTQAPDEVRQANLLLGDIGETAQFASESRLREATLVPFRPIKFMLASPEETAAAVWERVGGWTGIRQASGTEQPSIDPLRDNSQESPRSAPANCWIEDKYDGIRCQLHKVGGRVALYSRDLKEITTTFPELADSMRLLSKDLILDGEIVAMRGAEVLPFSELQRRLGRRQGDLFMQEEVPIKLVAFDLLWMEGESLLAHPLRERREALEAVKQMPNCLQLARITRVDSVEGIDATFDAARVRGNEGLMIKDPSSPYTPGRRGLSWLKLKKAYATLDCVVVGAEYGHGKRSKVLSDYTFAVRDETTGELKTIGKAYSGLTDVEIAELTQHFLKSAVRQQGRYFEVPPEVVLEIAFDRIQLSARHTSGLAMRFPRILRIRTDKAVADIDTVAAARRLGSHSQPARSTSDLTAAVGAS
ncbi:MAG TPA: ATP-dependent DNA ligase [Clostridia bacterium]|nr:ATP-dependent DNA ligase [Clostridia bacterium]